MSPYTILDNVAYFDEITQAVARTQAGGRVALMSMSFDPTEPLTHPLVRELAAAARRGVHVVLVIDAYAFMVDDAHMLPSGPLFWHRDMRRTHRADYRAKLHALDELVQAGGHYALTNWPPRPFVNPYAGRSHIKCTIIDNAAYVGGCNLSITQQLDAMVRATKPTLVEWLYEFVLAVAHAGRIDAALQGNNVQRPIDDSSSLLVDAGRKNDSLIYDHALALIDSAKEWLLFTCQYFPTGDVGARLAAAYDRGVHVKLIYNHASKQGLFRPAHELVELRERLRRPRALFAHQLPASSERLHYKLIATEAGALIGSHNYVPQGVRLGTAEIALEIASGDFARAAAQLVLAHTPYSHKV